MNKQWRINLIISTWNKDSSSGALISRKENAFKNLSDDKRYSIIVDLLQQWVYFEKCKSNSCIKADVNIQKYAHLERLLYIVEELEIDDLFVQV